MTKYGLYCTQPLAVDMPALGAVNLALHPLNHASPLLFGDIQRNVNLSGSGLFLVSQAALSQAATATAFLKRLELHE